MGCGNISKISLDISDGLLEDLKKQALEIESDYSDLIVEYVKQGLNGRDDMSMISLNDNVMEKVNLMVKLTDKTPEEVVNDALWEQLGKIEDVQDEIDGDRLWEILDHDNPEGDDILDNLIRLGEEGWD